MIPKDAGSRVIAVEGSSGHRRAAGAGGAAGTWLADNTPGAGPEYDPDQECWREKGAAECWPGEPGDQWGWTFLPARLDYGRPPLTEPSFEELSKALFRETI